MEDGLSDRRDGQGSVLGEPVAALHRGFGEIAGREQDLERRVVAGGIGEGRAEASAGQDDVGEQGAGLGGLGGAASTRYPRSSSSATASSRRS